MPASPPSPSRSLLLGIDTGGTFTDAVVYDEATSTVVATAKSPTTHHDLAIGILGAYVVAVRMIGLDEGNFWGLMQSRVDVWRDVGNGIVKSFVFGVICTAVALYQGYETEATPEGVAYATTRTVVISSLAVLGMDFVLTALMFSTP